MEVLKLGVTMISMGNKGMQDHLIVLYKTSLKQFTSGQYFLPGIKKIIREGIAKSVKAKKPNQVFMKILLYTLQFLQNLCEGHNKQMKSFLSSQNLSFANVDLVSETSKLVE
jgi:hypothetical protein